MPFALTMTRPWRGIALVTLGAALVLIAFVSRKLFPFELDESPRLDRYAWSVPVPPQGEFALCLGRPAGAQRADLSARGCSAFLGLATLRAAHAADLQLRVRRDAHGAWHIESLDASREAEVMLPGTDEFVPLSNAHHAFRRWQRAACRMSGCEQARVRTRLTAGFIDDLRSRGARALDLTRVASGSPVPVIIALRQSDDRTRWRLLIAAEGLSGAPVEVDLDVARLPGIYALSPEIALQLSPRVASLRCVAGGCSSADGRALACADRLVDGFRGCGGRAELPPSTRSIYIRLGKPLQLWLPRDGEPLVIVRNNPPPSAPAARVGIQEMPSIRALRLPNFAGGHVVRPDQPFVLEPSTWWVQGAELRPSNAGIVRISPRPLARGGTNGREIAIDGTELDLVDLYNPTTLAETLVRGEAAPEIPRGGPRWQSGPLSIAVRLGPRALNDVQTPREFHLFWRPAQSPFLRRWDWMVLFLVVGQLLPILHVLLRPNPIHTEARSWVRGFWIAIALSLSCLVIVGSRLIAKLVVHSHLIQAESLLGKQLLSVGFFLPAVVLAATAAAHLDAYMRRQSRRGVIRAIGAPTFAALAASLILRLLLLCVDAPTRIFDDMDGSPTVVESRMPEARAWVMAAEPAAPDAVATLLISIAVCIALAAAFTLWPRIAAWARGLGSTRVASAAGISFVVDARARYDACRSCVRSGIRRHARWLQALGWCLVASGLLALSILLLRWGFGPKGIVLSVVVAAVLVAALALINSGRSDVVATGPEDGSRSSTTEPPKRYPAGQALRIYGGAAVVCFVVGVLTEGWISKNSGFKVSELLPGLFSIAFGYTMELGLRRSTEDGAVRSYAESSERADPVPRPAAAVATLVAFPFALAVFTWVRIEAPLRGNPTTWLGVAVPAIGLVTVAVGAVFVVSSYRYLWGIFACIIMASLAFTVLYYLNHDAGPGMTLLATALCAVIFISLDSSARHSAKAFAVGVWAVVLAGALHLSVAALRLFVTRGGQSPTRERSLERIDCFHDINSRDVCEQWLEGIWLAGRTSVDAGAAADDRLRFVAAMHHDLAFDAVVGVWGSTSAAIVLGLGASVAALLLLVASFTRDDAEHRVATLNAPDRSSLMPPLSGLATLLLGALAALASGWRTWLSIMLGALMLLAAVLTLVQIGSRPPARERALPQPPRVALAAPIGLALFWTFSWATHVSSDLLLFLPTGVVLPFLSYSGFVPLVWVATFGAVASLSLSAWDSHREKRR